MDRIAIVGVGQTKYERRKKGEIFYDLVYEVTVKAMEDAGFTLNDIDNVITISNDFWDGRTISCMAVQEAAGAHEGPGRFRDDPGGGPLQRERRGPRVHYQRHVRSHLSSSPGD